MRRADEHVRDMLLALDLDIVWGVVERDLPSLRAQLARVLRDMSE